MVENVCLNFLFGRVFSYGICWPEICLTVFGRDFPSKNAWWRMSLHSLCWVEISLMIFVGRIFSSQFLVGISLQKMRGGECLFTVCVG